MPKKGPPVYLEYDQAALDAAYDQAAYAPNREQLIKRRISDSELTRLRIGQPERVAYGPADIERLDIYRTERDAAPVFVFIHGGAWRSGRSNRTSTALWRKSSRFNGLRTNAMVLAPRRQCRGRLGGRLRSSAGEFLKVGRQGDANRLKELTSDAGGRGAQQEALAILLKLDFLQSVEIAQDVVPFGCDVVPAEAILEFLDPTWTAGRDFAIENGRNAGG